MKRKFHKVAARKDGKRRAIRAGPSSFEAQVIRNVFSHTE